LEDDKLSSRSDMNFCPIPHTTRDQVWVGVGVFTGVCVAQAVRALLSNRIVAEQPNVLLAPSLTGRGPVMCTASPQRVFKLAVKRDCDAFAAAGRIESSLDKADGFIHLSDSSSPPKVASLFFKGSEDLYLIEIDTTKLKGPTQWIVGKMGDETPSKSITHAASTTVHYLIADGCVHVYGAPVVWSAVAREPCHVPLGPDGVHQMPAWL
jgi:uncharacterized protein (DUF952 family)